MSKSKKGDSKYFSTAKKGSEVHDFKQDLNSLNPQKVIETLKKVMAAMTVGKDKEMSSLFMDVVKTMQNDSFELKKLVYLYIINYATSMPEQAILIVSTLLRDCKHRSPLVRALALRTMGCIRIERIAEYLCEPLTAGFKDENAYVRKTAAVCTTKLYATKPELVEEQGYLDVLRKMIGDSNPMVVANAVNALSEIAELSGIDTFKMNSGRLSQLQAALDECNEWGQVSILDCLARHVPTKQQAQDVCERVCPRLKHANAAVSMTAIKVIVKYMKHIDDEQIEQKLVKDKLAPPLLTLLSEHHPEIQYIALRNINLIVQRHPALLGDSIRHFFCKYNDPIYVKMEKLELMMKLATENNIDKVLVELREYATEVDVEFVRKAVHAIGRCAIKLENAARRCVKSLVTLIETKVNYVVQEAICVIKDIFRKYPNQYESIIAVLCNNLASLDEPDAKEAMVWIIGEYSDRIDNAPALLQEFAEGFDEEPAQVQLQLLTACVKLFLKRPEEGQQLVADVIKLATEGSENPDLRDRGYVYWRLLSKNINVGQAIVLCERPMISNDTFELDQDVLDVLMDNISSLASIYHKPPEAFVKFSYIKSEEKAKAEEEGSGSDSSSSGDSSDSSSSSDSEDDDGMDAAGPSDGVVESDGGVKFEGAKGGNVVYDKDGIKIATRYIMPRKDVQPSYPSMALTVQNGSIDGKTLTQFAMKFNSNTVGIVPQPGVIKFASAIAPGATGTYNVALAAKEEPSGSDAVEVQMALKLETGLCFFADTVPAYLFFEADGAIERAQFIATWGSFPAENEISADIPGRLYQSVDEVKARLANFNIFFITYRHVPGKGDCIFASLRLRGFHMLCEIVLDGAQCTASIKAQNVSLSRAALGALRTLLTSNNS